MDGLQYTFSGVIKQWLGSKSTWHYVPLPLTMSDEINTLRQYHQSKRRGWGGSESRGHDWHAGLANLYFSSI